jgi:hypothetical protein
MGTVANPCPAQRTLSASDSFLFWDRYPADPNGRTLGKIGHCHSNFP